MKKSLTHIGVVGFVMFALLFGSTSWVQFVTADSLNANPLNNRQILDQLSRDRGPILVDGTPIAYSEPVDDRYRFQRQYGSDGLDPRAYASMTGYYSIVSGASGMERAAGDYLSGDSDALFYDKVGSFFTGEQPRGAAVELTVDPDVQQAAWDGLGNQTGAAVALDPKTGKILAMASTPGWDPNPIASHNPDEARSAFEQLNNDPENPAYNRAIGGNLYPPGSTFKVLVAAAALESGDYTPDSRLNGPATLDLPQTTATISNSHAGACRGGGRPTLAESLAESCNTSFASLGMDLGEDAIAEQAAKFGFGQDLSIPLTVTPSTFPSDLNPPQLAQSSLGQFEVRSTPMQMAMMTAGIANDGRMMKPELVNRVLNANTLEPITETRPTELSRPVSGQTAEELNTMMQGVVTDGTASVAQIPGVQVAAKTGTAQHAQGAAPHAWFISFAPADDPQIAVAVVVENGGNAGNEAYGATVAGPIAKDMMEAVVDK
ncbi:peptidoglycan D,D-transpeptidase FtsI family protein [Brevibacterium casei]|jgi:peptidoglycan glycosyltransferase|uniref:Penicillin-binding protein 2 n=1 Tax=Brevibacterium casei TaxID=33889 RepID=A0A7T4A0N7_9MICO|nr:penicillin-binding transpeptidase domain-containing protein [Brevibacterium casei]MCT2182065.1 penicillin-binding transpeptidase domain-containing protein [Brevibacterium casei]QQB15102.1 penicillin-binding protein 2 [Brevibacterium casei]QZE25834.1 penicillin-binding protein 2 [Brevibacterium casei]